MGAIWDALADAVKFIKTELGETLAHYPMTSTMRDIVTNIVDARIADNADKTAVSIERGETQESLHSSLSSRSSSGLTETTS